MGRALDIQVQREFKLRQYNNATRGMGMQEDENARTRGTVKTWNGERTTMRQNDRTTERQCHRSTMRQNEMRQNEGKMPILGDKEVERENDMMYV
jgi:hypothetical protein